MKRASVYSVGVVFSVSLLSVFGCESPVVPSWDLEVRIPSIADTLAVQDYIPEPFTVEGDAIVLPDETFEHRVSLMEICGDCTGDIIEGKLGYPSIRYTAEIVPPFPDVFVAAEFAAGSLTLDITHPFPYDLLRSSTGEHGFISLEVVDSTGATSIRQVVSGEDTSFRPGDTVRVALPLSGVTLRNDSRLYLRLYSPGTTEVTSPLDPTGALDIQGGLLGVKLLSVTAKHEGLALDQSFSGTLDNETRMRLQQPDVTAWVNLDVDHPLDLAGAIEVSFGSIIGDDTVSVAEYHWPLDVGSFDARLELTPNHIRHLLSGEGIYVSLSGGVEPGQVTVRATDNLIVSAEIGTQVGMKWAHEEPFTSYAKSQ